MKWNNGLKYDTNSKQQLWTFFGSHGECEWPLLIDLNVVYRKISIEKYFNNKVSNLLPFLINKILLQDDNQHWVSQEPHWMTFRVQTESK